MKPSKPVKALRHKADKRAHIPSAEEAGYETASARVQETPDPHHFSLNPIVQRGQDPELNWLDKYQQRELRVPVRSLYRHEHIAPEQIIRGLYRTVAVADKQQPDLDFSLPELFGNATSHDELDKVSDYYQWSDGWMNRLIQGDSLLSMTSLLEREGMAGQVQCFYFDPPYGIKYGSNWQIRLNSRTVTDGQDDSLSGEPEQIKAFRDTWELGIHSYLSYLRDRLLVARELLHDSGSCFVQISDENVHLVRCLMDEMFGSANFVSQISFVKTSSATSQTLPTTHDFVIWYAKDREKLKYRQLLVPKSRDSLASTYKYLERPTGEWITLSKEQLDGSEPIPSGKRFWMSDLTSQNYRPARTVDYTYNGKVFHPGANRCWSCSKEGLDRLSELDRLIVRGSARLCYKRFVEDFPYETLTHVWDDTTQFSSDNPYVVSTAPKVIQRCILMTTDPGDLVVDPTCGSGTTAYLAEQWGRRWITTDTSRIALNIAKTRLMTATFPFYALYDTEEGERAVVEKKAQAGQHESLKARDPKQPLRGHNVRYGFVYKKASHATLKSIAYNEPADEETLYDQPLKDDKRLRVAGPFTVETLQNYEPISPEELARQREQVEELAAFEDLIFEHLKSAGVKTGDKSEQAVFTRIDRLSSTALHAEGWYPAAAPKMTNDENRMTTEAAPLRHSSSGIRHSVERKAYLHVGPKFGTVSKQAVTEAIKACRDKRDGDWLLILGFAFESGITELSRSFGNFQVSIVRMHDDLLQEGLLKKDKRAASFVTIGEPDIRLHPDGDTATVEIAGLDIYDPIRDEVKSRDVHDIAYWMLDDDYDGSNFIVRQVFFCGGDKDEFDGWKKGLSDLAAAATKKKVEQTLKLEIDAEAFANAYGHQSRPFAIKAGQKIGVRVVSQFGEETTKVLTVK